jgi:endonuclease YncB( thermonuclease family)
VTRGFRTIRDGVTAFALLAAIWLIAAKLNDGAEIAHSGRFHAADGDSLAIGDERMRLKGIDAPELSQTCERGGARWGCGQEAKRMLQSIVAAADTRCAGTERDRFQRLLVICRAQGVDINGTMVRRGMAVSYGAYAGEEAQARSSKVGLWAGTFEMPRVFRDHRGEGENSGGRSGFLQW